MKLFAFTLVALMLHVTSLVNAQKNAAVSKGYIIKSGQKIDGEIRSVLRRRVHLVCSFRPAGSDSFTDYKPGEIESYFMTGEGLFRSKLDVPVDGKDPQDLFLLELVSGKVTLFQLIDRGSKPAYFIEKDTSLKQLVKMEKYATLRRTGSKISDNHYRRTLNVAFMDCPQNTTQVNFGKSGLEQVVNNYNACNNPVYKRNSFKHRKIGHIGFTYAPMLFTLDVEPISYLTKANQVAIMRADVRNIESEIQFSGFSSGITYEFGFLHNKHFTVATGILLTGCKVEHGFFTLDYQNIDVPLMLKYTTVLKSRLRPFAGAGFIFPKQIRNQLEVREFSAYYYLTYNGLPMQDDGIADGNVKLQEEEEFQTAKVRTTATAGLEFAITDRIKVSAQFRAESSSISTWHTIHLRQRSVFSTLSYRL